MLDVPISGACNQGFIQEGCVRKAKFISSEVVTANRLKKYIFSDVVRRHGQAGRAMETNALLKQPAVLERKANG